jgi:hypothetical protein
MGKATDEQSELMATIIRRLRFKAEKYRSEAYPNPGELILSGQFLRYS